MTQCYPAYPHRTHTESVSLTPHKIGSIQSSMTTANPLTPDELRGWRDRLEWTRRRAAEWLRVPVATYKNWENGHRTADHSGAIRKLMEQAETKYRKRTA